MEVRSVIYMALFLLMVSSVHGKSVSVDIGSIDKEYIIGDSPLSNISITFTIYQ